VSEADIPPIEPVVEVVNLSKVFEDEGRGRVEAVKDISFNCFPGEILGLLGANGAGKTTTLRILSTILQPSGGRASVMGFETVEAPLEVRRRIGFYSASTALYPRLTPRETIDFFARINKVPKNQVPARVAELIEDLGLGPYADARVEKLSSGMKQKVSIARTIAHDPPVLIFDEPTVGLDILNALDFHRCLQDLRGRGKSIVLSTHIMSEAEKLCDRIAIVAAGRVLALDTLEGLRKATNLHYLEEIFVHYMTPGHPA
jgi:sodium transport system ATP-binding protein